MMEAAIQRVQFGGLNILKTIRHWRISQHLRRVEYSLRANVPDGLTPELRSARINTLDNLHEYWQRGEFPINDVATYSTPVFKDNYGNYCAVGYLLSKAGFDKYVTEIKNTDNLIRVNDITDKKYVAAIEALGITKNEAARIQPSYDYEPYIAQADPTTTIIRLVAVVIFILLQLSAFFLIKEMNLTRKLKIYSFLTTLFFSSLILTAIIALLQSINNY